MADRTSSEMEIKKKKRKSRPGKRDRALMKLANEQELQVEHSRAVPPSGPLSTSPTWSFTVDYNDHFETPSVAYQHLLPWLQAQADYLNKPLKDLIVYDPYYCNGRMINLLYELGVTKVINENIDFYGAIKRNTIPEHDVLVTNPPYSGVHKTLLLEYLASAASKAKPFALLLPSYCTTKSYWKQYIQNSSEKVFYLVPAIHYEYLHPEGTGKDIPPFHSAWFVGQNKISIDMVVLRKKLEATSEVKVAETQAELSAGGVRLEKRLNPKQRKRRRKD